MNLRRLGIGVLILSSIRIPLPQADYHNIRHHDGPGEVCVYHDHLLRWHPAADRSADVSMLHWHWFLPVVEPGAGGAAGNDENRSPLSGPALHAHLGDWPDHDWTGTPLIRPDIRGRSLDVSTLRLAGIGQAGCTSSVLTVDPGPPMHSAGALSCAATARASVHTLTSRWNC